MGIEAAKQKQKRTRTLSSGVSQNLITPDGTMTISAEEAETRKAAMEAQLNAMVESEQNEIEAHMMTMGGTTKHTAKLSMSSENGDESSEMEAEAQTDSNAVTRNRAKSK